MRRLLLIALLCGCAGSLVDSASLTGGGPGGSHPCTSADQCPTPAAGVAACIAGACSYECQGGQLKTSNGACSNATAITAGTSHTCAVAANEARCWGANNAGQLGRAGDSSPSFVPVKVEIPGTPPLLVTAIAAGSAHTCAIANGDVWCWGDNTFGQLGIGTIGVASGGPTPKQATTGPNAVQLAAGGAHTCYADSSAVFCWGKDDQGQVGDGALLPAPVVPTATAVAGISGPSTIAAGDSHTCAIASGGVWCWGANGAGQLGIGSGTAAKSTPQSVSVSAQFIGLGVNHSCAGVTGGSLSCWGANASFQVDGSGADQDQPTGAPTNGASAVAGGTGHSCAIRRNDVTCWGLNDKGQLGSGQLGHGPVDMGLSGVSAVAAGFKHTCAIDSGAVKCWGLNQSFQLGVASPADFSSAPVPVSGR